SFHGIVASTSPTILRTIVSSTGGAISNSVKSSFPDWRRYEVETPLSEESVCTKKIAPCLSSVPVRVDQTVTVSAPPAERVCHARDRSSPAKGGRTSRRSAAPDDSVPHDSVSTWNALSEDSVST